jgi:aromatic-L-amino-acid decarboxylase
MTPDADSLRTRRAPLEMSGDEFRRLGRRAVDLVADLLDSLPRRPVTPGEMPSEIRAVLGDRTLPETGVPAERLLEELGPLLLDHSLFNGHGRFLGYITSSAAPIGALADLVAAGVNPNLGGWPLSPMATEIEAQTVRWLAEFMGYPTDCGGILVSGGNMANFVGFLAARRAKAPWDIRERGLAGGPPLTVYASEGTHTWIQKAADLFGLGTDMIRWIPAGPDAAMDVSLLEPGIETDRAAGRLPFLVVGTAGSVGLGAIDALPRIAEICRKHDLWFHVDGAYGAPAAALPEAPTDLKGLREADSVAVDPHKWLYSPLEAGCTLVRRPGDLIEAFSFHPEYYHLENPSGETMLNYHEFGMQNSRGFRALKVWLALRQVGREGYVRMIRDDVALAAALYDRVRAEPELEAVTRNLSVTTFRFVPGDLETGTPAADAYLNELNEEILERIQYGGEVFVSNAVLGEAYLLRSCVVNFRTTLADIEAIPGIVARVGREVDREKRPPELGRPS